MFLWHKFHLGTLSILRNLESQSRMPFFTFKDATKHCHMPLSLNAVGMPLQHVPLKAMGMPYKVFKYTLVLLRCGVVSKLLFRNKQLVTMLFSKGTRM